MSVFSLDVAADNPVTEKDLDEACSFLGVAIKDNEKREYLNLLAVYHDSMAKLMGMEGQICLSRLPQ
jgi:amidase